MSRLNHVIQIIFIIQIFRVLLTSLFSLSAIIYIEQLANTEEFVDGNLVGALGEVLIRCNNILYIKEVPEEDEGAMKEWLESSQ